MDQLEFMMLEYPILRTIMIVMVMARLIFKPIFSIISKYVELTIEVDDDKKLAQIMNSKWYKLTAYILDMTLSVKLPAKKK